MWYPTFICNFPSKQPRIVVKKVQPKERNMMVVESKVPSIPKSKAEKSSTNYHVRLYKDKLEEMDISLILCYRLKRVVIFTETTVTQCIATVLFDFLGQSHIFT